MTNSIVHDAEYYILYDQHGERWAVEDNELDAKLAELEGRTGPDYLERFFRYWTLRESYCKATGLGIARAPKNFAFQVSSAGDIAIRFEPQDMEAADQWQFACLRPASEHLVAVAAHTGRAADREVVAGYLVV